MEKKELKLLMQKHLDRTISEVERIRLDRWYLHHAKNSAPLTDETVLVGRMMELDKALGLDHLPEASQILPARKLKLWPRLVGVAAAVAAITFGIWLYYSASIQRHPELVSGSQDIAPGKNTATLSINNGEVITLNESKTGVIIDASQIKYNDGTKLRAEETKTLTVTTPRGGTYQVRLPDGTNVWLNAASSLTYATALKERGVERVVKLSGEAYFEVAKDKSHPFKVSTKQQEVEVLGTHFNIDAYPENAVIRTTLAEGSIKISVLKKRLILKPNEQATLLAGELKKTTVDAEFALAWKSGFFLFNRERLESIMLKVARWYDVDVVYSDESLKAETFTGTISRYENISQVFGMLERTGVAKFKIDDKKVTIIKIKKD